MTARRALESWVRWAWWADPKFDYPVRWWHTLDRVVSYILGLIIVIYALLGPILQVVGAFCL